MFGPSSAYIRLARVNEDAAAGFSDALRVLAATNKLEGLVLDLRFAAGTDYAAAARLAGQFLGRATVVMSLGGQEFASPAGDSAFTLPTMVLVNGRTSGAAEALAEVLRQNEAALIIGNRTAGAAGVFEDFVLTTGQRLRVVTATVKLREGTEVPPGGVTPDIAISASLADERSFLENPYGSSGRTNAAAGTRPARLTEADLVRMRRERRDTPSRAPVETPATSVAPVVADPVLARALDLLKGIALVKPPRRI
jgi:C-terminal processing protease CtpA/Prc